MGGFKNNDYILRWMITLNCKSTYGHTDVCSSKSFEEYMKRSETYAQLMENFS